MDELRGENEGLAEDNDDMSHMVYELEGREQDALCELEEVQEELEEERVLNGELESRVETLEELLERALSYLDKNGINGGDELYNEIMLELDL